jgi:nicotinamide mononucleotide adenylyltransferase
MKKVLFPCKCDPIHVGHLMQIKWLINKGYDVTVDIFWSGKEERIQSPWEIRYILYIIFNNRVHITTHDVSYAEGFPDGIRNQYDIVATGNDNLIPALVARYIPFIKLNRSPGYRASKMRKLYVDES